MTDRITSRHLEMTVKRLNELTDSPTVPYAKDENGKLRAQVGCYVIDSAYGGVALHQIMNEGGGVHDIFRSGHMTKRELFNRLHAYVNGREEERKEAVQGNEPLAELIRAYASRCADTARSKALGNDETAEAHMVKASETAAEIYRQFNIRL